MRKDHVGVQAPDRRRFSSFDDALQRLLPYHVFQGAPPSREEFSQGTSARREDHVERVPPAFPPSDLCSPSAVDEEFEEVATAVLSRTCAMVNKYRRLLLVEAEVGTAGFLLPRVPPCSALTLSSSLQHSSPSSEMVMIDRTFNQEERNTLTQDKRLVLVDPGLKTDTENPAVPHSSFNLASFPLQTAFWKNSAAG